MNYFIHGNVSRRFKKNVFTGTANFCKILLQNRKGTAIETCDFLNAAFGD
jgi:hypothetical protein